MRFLVPYTAMVHIGLVYFPETGGAMYEIGSMDRQAANTAFQNSGLRNIVYDGHVPVTGEMYFSAVSTIFRTLLENEEYLRIAIRDPAANQNGASQAEEEAGQRSWMENKVVVAMREVLGASRELLFERPDGLSEAIGNVRDNGSASWDSFTESIARETVRCVLGGDSIPGFMVYYKIGKYHDISSLVESFVDVSGFLGLRIVVPIHAGWETVKDPVCDIATYVLLVIFCIRLKVESHVLRSCCEI